ncbi:MAG: FAD-dependent oxidoreductase, partial [Dehalococcoidia bacterium]
RIDVYHGAGSLSSARSVRVLRDEGEPVDLGAGAILIATGSSPFRPPDVPFDDERIYDSDSILKLKDIPKTMAVIGGGVIGCEYAALFAALGVEVTQVTLGDALLPFVDREIADRLRGYLERLGLRILFNERVNGVQRRPGDVQLRLRGGADLSAEVALFAAGRSSNVEGLGLEALGVRMGERGLVLVDQHFQTSVPGVYAAGDVIGFPALASTSVEQGRAAVTHALNLPSRDDFSSYTPLAVYSIPEVAMVGLTEEKCIEAGVPYLTGRAAFNTLARGQIIGDDTGMVKLIFSPSDKKLLGAHLIGELASELVHIGAHVLAAGGTIDTFIHMVYNFPTLSDAYKYAAYDGLGRHDRWLVEHGLLPESQLPPLIPPLLA